MTAAQDLAADLVELAPWTPPAASAPLREVGYRANAWLPSEDGELRRRFLADEAIGTIAEAIGRSFQATRHRVCELGLRRNSILPWNELEEAELARRYGLESAATIARDLGRSVSSVYARARFHRLSEEQAPQYDGWEDLQIRTGYEQGVPAAQIAVLLGRTLSGVATRAHYLGLRHLHARDDWFGEEVVRLLELAESGMRYLAIIEQLAAEGFPRRTKNGLGQKLRKVGYGRGWGRAWLPEEDELLRRAYQDGESLTPLRSGLGRTQCSLRWRAEYLGLRGTHKNRNGFRLAPDWTEEDEAFLRANFGKMKSPELARQLGRTKAAMFTRANVLGLVHGYIRAFTPDEDRAILIGWEKGLSLVDVAEALDRDSSVVMKRCRRAHDRSYSDPDRPARGPRGPRAKRPRLTLQAILDMGGQHA